MSFKVYKGSVYSDHNQAQIINISLSHHPHLHQATPNLLNLALFSLLTLRCRTSQSTYTMEYIYYFMSRQPKQFPPTQKYKPKPEIDTAFLPPKITCRKCNKSLPHDAFTHSRLSHKDFVCKTCYNKQAKKYQKIYKHNNKA